MADHSDIAFRFSLSELEQYRGAIHRRPEAPQVESAARLPAKAPSRIYVKITAGVLIGIGLFALFGSSRTRRIDNW